MDVYFKAELITFRAKKIGALCDCSYGQLRAQSDRTQRDLLLVNAIFLRITLRFIDWA